MFDFIDVLFSSDYMPHGHCYLWQSDLLWLHVGSDGLIAASYLSIPFTLAYFVSRHTDLVFKWLFLMFGAFILACGFTHLLGIWSVWHGNYYLTGFSKLLTGILSIATAITIWPFIPKAIAIPGPKQQNAINQKLQAEVAERQLVEEELRKHKDKLEALVEARTREIEQVNAELRKALDEQAMYAQTLKESQERFALAVQGSNSGIWDWFDVARDEEWWSPRFYELLGYEEGEITASLSQFKALLHPDDQEDTFNLVEAHFKGTAAFDIEYRLKTKSEGYKWFRGMGAVTYDATGSPLRMVGSISDIDRRKKAEASLKQYAHKLEQARDKAEEGTRTKSEFLANMSHEIRTPMNSILGYSELLEDTPLTDNQQDYLTTIRDNGQRLLFIINDILDLSKIEAGHLELEAKPFNTEDLIRSVLDVFSLQAKEKGISMDYTIHAGVPEQLVGDEARLRQLLINLVSNAVKFTHEGSVEVELTSSSHTQDQIHLTFSVRDTGIGIHPDKLEEIFNTFTQIDASDTRTYGGTGLGLAISRRLAEAMHGEITVSSVVDKGSVFEAQVLVRGITRRSTINYTGGFRKNHALRSIHPGKEDTVPQDPLHILLADDDLSNQKLAVHFLSPGGHTIDVAENGEEAIQYIDTREYDIVLMDIQMPRMDGMEVTQYIRKKISLPKQPYIIAVTARAMHGEREQFIASGMDGYLSKPYTRAELLEVIRHRS